MEKITIIPRATGKDTIGKSFFPTNLAIALYSTVAVNFDLRSSQFHNYYKF